MAGIDTVVQNYFLAPPATSSAKPPASRNVRYRTVHDPLQPILYYYQTNGFNRLVVRYARVDRAVLKARIEGARTRNILQLLVWQFSKPVLIANFDRLAGRVVVHAQLAQHADRAWADAVRARGPAGVAGRDRLHRQPSLARRATKPGQGAALRVTPIPPADTAA